MILIADAHAGNEGNLDEFFTMLTLLESSSETVVFLGDVFDLWIGMPRYERDEHRRFIAWCNRQRERRTIGFIEGNHEFFITGYRDDCFTWCTDTRKRIGDIVFSHGDLINTNDLNYQRFRARTRTPSMRRLIRFLPFGPVIVHQIKRRTKKTNREFRNLFPEAEIRAFTQELGDDGVLHAFIGHFHTPYRTIEEGGCTVHCIPGWYVNGEVVRFDEATSTATVGKLADLI